MKLTTKQENILLVIHRNADPGGAHGVTINGTRYVSQARITNDLLLLEPDIFSYDKAYSATRQRLARLEKLGLAKRALFGTKVWAVTPKGYEALDAAREVAR